MFSGKVGIATVDITPSVGVYARNWGAATHDVAESIHRPLTLNVLTLQSGSADLPLVLIEADLGFWRELTFMNSIRDRACTALSIGPERFIFSLTHTHAGPRIVDTTSEVAGGDLLETWKQETIDKAQHAIERALATAEPSLLEWHTGHCQLAANRDLIDPDPARRRRICGYAPGARADTTLLVGRVTSAATSALRAVLVNYACHPTTLAFDNRALSPDFIGATRETVTQATGSGSVFFLQGASGELAPRYQYVADTAVADRHGRQLGYAALATLEDMEAPGTRLEYQGTVESGAPLAIWRPVPQSASTELTARMSHVPLPLKDLPTSDELKQQLACCSDRALAERLNRKLDVRSKIGDGRTFELPIYGWKIGSAILIGTMTEAYSLFQTAVRHAFPEKPLICMNMINGWVGYLAPQELYDEDIYQVWQSPFDRGSLELMISAAIGLISELDKS